MSFGILRGFANAALLICVAACSGGGNSPTPGPSPTASNGAGISPTLDRKVSFTVNVPAVAVLARQARRFRRRASTPAASPSPSSGVYVSPNIASITIRLVEVNGVSLANPPAATGPVNAPTTCASGAGCTFGVPSVVAAVGTNFYDVQTYAGPNATGNPISSGLVSVSVSGSGAVDKALGDPTELSAGGYVYGLNLVAAPATFVLDEQSAVTLDLTATDATGATLIGNVQYFSPVTLTPSGTGITLAGPGLTSTGGLNAVATIVLDGPAPASPAIFAVYNGALGVNGASVTAATTDGNGNPIQSTVTIGFATPAPSPTPRATATPTPAPTTAAGPPDSVYVINAATNAITEFPDPGPGGNPPPRRIFGGGTIACAGTVNASFILPALLAITVDSAGNVTVPSGGQSACSGQSLTFNRFGPTTLPTDPPATAILATLPNKYLELQADPGSPSAVYESDDDGLNSNAIQRLDLSGASVGGSEPANPTAPEFGQLIAGNNNCIVSSGRPVSGASPCFSAASVASTFSYSDTEYNEPFVRLGDGTLAAAAEDNSNSQPALVFLPPQTPTTSAPDQAGPVWIESPTLFSSYPISLAYDATTNLIYAMFDDSMGAGNCSPPGDSTLRCADGVSHAYVEAFDYGKVKTLVSGGSTGAQALAPTFTLGGVAPGKFGLPIGVIAGPGVPPEPNVMAAANGRLYIANIVPNGFCNASCQLLVNGSGSSTLAYPYSGQIDVYNVSSLTGYDIGNTAPIASIENTGGTNNGLSVPVGVAVGPTGSVTATARFRPRPASRFLTPRQRALLLRERETYLRRRALLRR